MGNMDGQARPNVAVQPGSECAQRCGCSAECCRRLMGGGGHIVSAPTKQEGASRASVHMQGLCDFGMVHMVQIGWRLDTELNTDIPMVYKTPSGTSVEMCMCGWVAWWVV